MDPKLSLSGERGEGKKLFLTTRKNLFQVYGQILFPLLSVISNYQL